MSVTLRISGPQALFTRLEYPVERVSYDVPTPSAIIGLVSAIHWKPAVRWVVNRITVRAPIRHMQLRRNEVRHGMSPRRARIDTSNSDHKAMRSSLVLVDVDYLVTVHAEPTGRADDQLRAAGVNITGKHEAILRRRAAKGQHHHHPALGCREFLADVRLADGAEHVGHESLRGERHLDRMLHSIDYQTRRPIMYRPKMRDGVIEVPDIAIGDMA